MISRERESAALSVRVLLGTLRLRRLRRDDHRALRRVPQIAAELGDGSPAQNDRESPASNLATRWLTENSPNPTVSNRWEPGMAP